MTGEARHSLLLSDRDIALIERALLAYAQVLRIHTDGKSYTKEADGVARTTSRIQIHRNCQCPTEVTGGS